MIGCQDADKSPQAHFYTSLMPHAHNALHIYGHIYGQNIQARARTRLTLSVQRVVLFVCVQMLLEQTWKSRKYKRGAIWDLVLPCLSVRTPLWFPSRCCCDSGENRKNKLQGGVLFSACARNWIKKKCIKTHLRLPPTATRKVWFTNLTREVWLDCGSQLA